MQLKLLPIVVIIPLFALAATTAATQFRIGEARASTAAMLPGIEFNVGLSHSM